MTVRYDPDRHHRRSIRLKDYDYTATGAYFITVCTQERACLFGDVANGLVRLNDAGKMVVTVWSELPGHYPGVEIDAFVVMPNHLHGIVVLVGAGPRACPDQVAIGQPRGVAPTHVVGFRACPDQAHTPMQDRDPSDLGQPPDLGQPRGVAPTMSLADVVHRFKTLTTKLYADGVHQSHWPPFAGRLWQRNYYEHVVRDDADLTRIRHYITENPARWHEDPDNPQSAGAVPRGRPGQRTP